MAVDWDIAEQEVADESYGTGSQMIRTGAGDLTGVAAGDANIMRSPCAMLKWLEDNTPFKYEAFVILTYDSGYQGCRITRKSNGTLVKRIRFPINAKEDSSPYKQIPINHTRMLRRLIAHVIERQET